MYAFSRAILIWGDRGMAEGFLQEQTEKNMLTRLDSSNHNLYCIILQVSLLWLYPPSPDDF